MAEKTFTFDLTKLNQLKAQVKPQDTIPICECGTKMAIEKGAEKASKTNQISRQYKCPKCGSTKRIKTQILTEPDTIVIPDYGHAITKLFDKVYLELEKKYQAEIAKSKSEQPPKLIDIIRMQAQPALYIANSFDDINITHLLDRSIFDALGQEETYALLRTFFFAAIGQKDKETSESIKKIGTRAGKKVKALNSKGDLVIMEYPKADKKVSRNTKTGQKKERK